MQSVALSTITKTVFLERGRAFVSLEVANFLTVWQSITWAPNDTLFHRTFVQLLLYSSVYLFIYSNLFFVIFQFSIPSPFSCLFYSVTSERLETRHVYWWPSDTELHVCHATDNNLVSCGHHAPWVWISWPIFTKFGTNIMPIQDITHHMFRFPTIGNNPMADLQNFEVRSTLTFRSKDDAEKEVWRYATFGGLITLQNVKSQAGRREKDLHASDGN
jgi:hypothetical protein